MPFNLLLLPLVGGYYLLVTSRFTKYIHHAEQDITFTTEYWDVYQQRQEEGEEDMYRGFLLVLATGEIVSASLFDLAVYDRFEQSK